MSKPSCPRLFEVEAMRDGRLEGAELTRFEHHMASCVECSREAQALEVLAEAARVSGKSDHDELHARRERTRLLAAFDDGLVPKAEKTIERRWIRPASALVVLLLLVVVGRAFVTKHGSSGGAPALTTAVSVSAPAASPLPERSTVIQADSTALYSKRIDGNKERIVLERGALRIQVLHANAADVGALLVMLPDGELEDSGTTFTVTVTDGRTTRVSVEEGSILLRLHGRSAIALRGGETWSADPRAPASATAVAIASSIASPSASGALGDASKDFRDAMTALNGDQPRRAAASFEQFLKTYPRDPRAEDAAYLRVVALQRAGADDEMREAARSYLQAYPAGFRRAEVEALSRPLNRRE